MRESKSESKSRITCFKQGWVQRQWWWWWRGGGAAFTQRMQRRRHWTTATSQLVKPSTQSTLLFDQLLTSACQSHLAHLQLLHTAQRSTCSVCQVLISLTWLTCSFCTQHKNPDPVPFLTDTKLYRLLRSRQAWMTCTRLLYSSTLTSNWHLVLCLCQIFWTLVLTGQC